MFTALSFLGLIHGLFFVWVRLSVRLYDITLMATQLLSQFAKYFRKNSLKMIMEKTLILELQVFQIPLLLI